MSNQNLYVLWKGIKSGPFSRSDLEKHFTTGRFGLLRTVIDNNTHITALEFVSSIESQKREEQLASQLKQKEEEALQMSRRMEEQAENHRLLLEEATQQRVIAHNPPPQVSLPDFKSPIIDEAPAKEDIPSTKSDNNTILLILGYISVTLSLITGLFFREVFTLIGFVLGIFLIRKKHTANGIIVMVLSILFYAIGRVLTDFVHDYLIQNYPN